MTLVENVRRHLAALNGPFPDDALCNHFGIGFTQGMFHIDLCDYGPLQTLVMAYSHRNAKFSQRVFEAIVTELTKIAPVVTKWNGMEEFSGISVVLDIPTPRGLEIGIRNYHKQKDVFDRSDATLRRYAVFKEALERNMRVLGYEDSGQ